MNLNCNYFRVGGEIDERELDLCTRISRIDEFKDHVRNSLVYELRAEIYGINHPDKHVIRYPETWWDAVKERFAPTWFLEKYPVVFVEITASLKEYYPEIRPALHDMKPVLKFMTIRTTNNKHIW